jgi:hypothetical protein
MSVVASSASSLNCSWIRWRAHDPVCIRPPGPPRIADDATCAVCPHWHEESTQRAAIANAGAAARTPPTRQGNPLNRDTCPLCHSLDIALVERDAVVDGYVCNICRQHWLATRAWPSPTETRSHFGGT